MNLIVDKIKIDKTPDVDPTSDSSDFPKGQTEASSVQRRSVSMAIIHKNGLRQRQSQGKNNQKTGGMPECLTKMVKTNWQRRQGARRLNTQGRWG